MPSVPPELVLFLAAGATAVATGIGVVPVLALGDRAGGVMILLAAVLGQDV